MQIDGGPDIDTWGVKRGSRRRSLRSINSAEATFFRPVRGCTRLDKISNHDTVDSLLTEDGLSGGFVWKIDWCFWCQKVNFLGNFFLKRNKYKLRALYFAFEYALRNSRSFPLLGCYLLMC